MVVKKTHARVFFDSFFCGAYFGKKIHPTAKVSEGTNRNMPARSRNKLVQLLALYTNPESQNAQRHRQTNRRTDRQKSETDDRITPVADHSLLCSSTIGFKLVARSSELES